MYSLVDPEVYEDLGRMPISDEFAREVARMLPAGWTLARHGIWLGADPPADTSAGPMPAEGFKIHVSTTPRQATETLCHTVPVLVDAGVSFKLCADPWFLFWVNSKGFPRQQSGKFITAYPPDAPAFEAVIEALHQRTKDTKLAGPHILSDRPYRDSRILFYRYGEFRAPTELLPDGTRAGFLENPDGGRTLDQRLPYVLFPEWVDDPLAADDGADDAGTIVLAGRYRIDGAFGFSNAGGVYHGEDLATGRPIAVKEARPFTNCWLVGDETWDAVTLLGREYRTLRRLEGLAGVPSAIDLAHEGGHAFLIEERVDGGTLDAFWAQQDMLLAPYVRRPGAVDRFIEVFWPIARQLIRVLRSIHERGVVLGDVSPGNILIDAETLAVTLVDFESAVIPDEDGELATGHAAVWGTPGYVAPERERRGRVVAEDDIVALGLTLSSAVVPANHLFTLEPGAQARMLARMTALGLPAAVEHVIAALVRGSFDDAEAVVSAQEHIARPHRPVPVPARAVSDRDLAESVRAIAEGLVASAAIDREDRIFPSHYAAFETNPLSLAYGAAGPTMFLADTLGLVPDDIAQRVDAAKLEASSHPPGLFVGLAGIAIGLAEAGLTGQALAAVGALRASKLRWDEASLAHGVAGWGLACLHLDALGLTEGLLEPALEAGEHLLGTAEPTEHGIKWPAGNDELAHFGFGYGASGVGLYLLHLYRATGDARFRVAAERGLAHDMAHRVETEVGWQWPRFEGDGVVYPYLTHGSAGIGAVAARFARWLGSDPYLEWARRIADDVAIKYSFIPSLFEGLAGVGELQLDMHLLTGESHFRAAAYDIAETIRWFEVRRGAGAMYPGRWLARLSGDYATGSAGIGLFFARLLQPGRRLLFDLPGDDPDPGQATGSSVTAPAEADNLARGSLRWLERPTRSFR